MEQRKIDSIIVKLIENKISDKETDFLLKWMEEEANKVYFDEFIEINYLINSKNSFDYSASLQKTKKIINRKWWKNYSKVLKYASVVVLFVGMTFYFIKQSAPNSVSSELQLKNEEITLEMDNGTKVIIPDSAQQKIHNKKGNLVIMQQGKKLNYQNGSMSESLVYNKLAIPYGKTFQVVLSDGTLVHLNAGTTLRYPEKFLKGNNRLVFVDGEAYFDVAKDKKHPFIVNAKGVNIRVTGTEFNVSCYKEDENINTVLVEGSISLYQINKLYDAKSVTKVVPGELAAWNKTKKKLAIAKVDVSIYTEWKEGVLVFKHMKFKDIIIKLERHFNVKIKNNNQKLNNEIFTARFENASIEHILKSFKDVYGINYSIVNNQIIIN